MNIVFFGAGPYVISIIEALNKNFELALVIATEKDPHQPVISYCLSQKIEHLFVNNFSDPTTRQKLSAIRTRLAVLAYFGLILPAEILNLFPKGILNVHPSLLPKYRGPTPGQTALLNGDKETGVTIIKLDEEVDHGPVLAQVKEPIFEKDTAESLYKRLFEKGAEMLPLITEGYLKGDIVTKEQDHKKATFTKRLTRQDGYIDLNNPPSPEIIDRMIRAYYPWPGAWTEFRVQNSEFRIKLLPEQKIQVEGKKPMSHKDFINGYPEGKEFLQKIRLGNRF